jgi:hypothetical protein
LKCRLGSRTHGHGLLLRAPEIAQRHIIDHAAPKEARPRASCLEKDRVAVPSFQTVVPQVDAVCHALPRSGIRRNHRSRSRECAPPKFSPNVWPGRPAPTETPVSSAHVAEAVCGDAQQMPARNPRLRPFFDLLEGLPHRKAKQVLPMWQNRHIPGTPGALH